MKVYHNCITFRSGVMPVHTLQIDGENIHVDHMNNLNKQCTLDNLRKYNYIQIATAYDTNGSEYAIYANHRYKVAVIDEYVKPLSVAEMIEKYNLPLTVEQYKQIFNID